MYVYWQTGFMVVQEESDARGSIGHDQQRWRIFRRMNLIPPLMTGKGITMYKASKHGVIGYLRGLKHYMPEANAHVTAIAPWMTKTYFGDLLD
jgi:NAD(P)-dependent dehydrogenase (short-subunit alcohol dehydrogenase family)